VSRSIFAVHSNLLLPSPLRLEYLSGLHGEVKAAEEDIQAWRTDRDEFADFLAKQGIDTPPHPIKDTTK
jgi:SMC interacting uncharacterized protein involved in chromosome segregation